MDRFSVVEEAKMLREEAHDALRARVAELHAALDLADCTQRDGGDVRRCGEVRCWRCRAEEAEQRVAELEADLADADEVRVRRCNELIRDSNDYARMVEQRINAAEQRVRELEARLQFDPGGSDKIDELDQVIQFLRHELDVTRTELGLKRSDCVRLGMDCDALKGEKKAAERRAKRLEGALREVLPFAESRVEDIDATSPVMSTFAGKALDRARAALQCAALAAGESQAAEGGEVSHA